MIKKVLEMSGFMVRLIQFALFLALLSIVIYFLDEFGVTSLFWKIIVSLTPLFLAFFNAWLVGPLKEYLMRKGNMTKYTASIIAMLTYVVIIIIVVFIAIPTMQSEVLELASQQETINRNLITAIEKIEDIFNGLDLSIYKEKMADANIFIEMGNVFDQATEFILSFIINLIFSVILGFFILLDGKPLNLYIRRAIKPKHHETINLFFTTISKQLSRYMYGSFVNIFIIGIIMTIIYQIVGLDSALLFGFLVGTLNIILYIGPYLAILPPTIYGFAIGEIGLGMQVFILTLAVSLLHKKFISKYFVGHSNVFSPQVAIAGFLVSTAIFGFVGSLLAYPFVITVSASFTFFNEKYNFYDDSLEK